MAPSSQTLPDHLQQQDPLKFSPRAVSRLDEEEEEEEEGWDRTLRPNALDQVTSRAVAHSRESSLEKLSQPPTAGTVASPRLHASQPRGAIAGIGGVIERVVDLKSASYGHHRQTSIVHGIQHSRNGSLASSSSSPLSPQMIAAAGVGLHQERPDIASVSTRLENDSRPPTALSGSTITAGPVVPERSSSATDATTVFGATQRKVERMNSRTRRDHSHHHSHSSRHHKDEQKTVGEYALHVLFTTFIAQAEEKLNECITVPFDPEPNVEQICGPGVDPTFDQLIVALGHIARQKPKPLIDIMMLWRKSKSDNANDARAKLQQSKNQLPPGPLQRRNTEPAQQVPGSAFEGNVPVSHPTLAAKQEYVAQSERRSTVSIFILCRVLLEVISQSNLSSITPEMEDKLEAIIFGQLKIADTEQLMVSPLKLANWNLFAQLLGVMSDINFTGVTDRFLTDMEKTLQELSAKNAMSVRDAESRMELVLGGMKHLRIKISPEESWLQSCDFLTSLGRLFHRSRGHKVKTAFCQVLEMLLLPIAARASNAELTHPKWGDVLSAISPRLAQMFVKPRHWGFAFPMTATMLCVSPPESFASQWLQLVLPLQTKIKDRYTKPTCLQVISRLVWTYLFRTNESVLNATRKLDEIVKLVLPTSKRVLIASDVAVAEPLIQIIRIIGYKYPEYCFKQVVFPLINAELFMSNKDLRVEQLDPDRIVIGIRAFLAIMADLERGEDGQPPFPQTYSSTSGERTPASPAASSTAQAPLASPLLRAKEESPTRPVLISSLGDGTREYYLKFCEILGKITLICDNAFGGQAALDEKFNSPGPKTPITDTFNFSRRDDHQTSTDQKQAFYELLHVSVQALPRCLSVDVPINSLINLLCTGTAHVQTNIAESSTQSLKAIARQSHAQQVTMGFARFIFNFDDRYSTMSDGGMLGPGHIENTLRLYVELLQIWIEEIRQKTKDASSDGPEAIGTDRRAMKLDLSSIWAEVDHAEAHGLFFLCSQSRRVRSFAITVLRLITEFDTALGKNKAKEKDSPRLIDVLENDSRQIMDFKDEQLTVAERSRLQRGKQNANDLLDLIELCTSDLSYDTTLWFKTIPNLIRIGYEKCPFTVTICRDLICNRILQMYKGIVMVSEPSRGPYPGSEPGSARVAAPRPPATQPEVLIEQWKLYLIFACSTLGDGGSGLGSASQSIQHARNKSSNKAAPVDKIVSARTLFKYLMPMLSVSSVSIRDAVVSAMGSINVHVYRTLLEELGGQVTNLSEEQKSRMHQRTNSSNRRNRKMDLLRTEITHVYKLTAHFLLDKDMCQEEWILNNLVVYTRDLKLFLMDGEVQMDWGFQKLRQHYCGLMEQLFEGINRTKDPLRWMTFESRKSAFSLMEDWCGFSPNHNQIRAREDTMRQSLIDQQTLGERGTVTAAIEIEKRNLRTAALSAMAALCLGPLSITTESGATLQFDIRRMLHWIESIFNSGSDRMNITGRRALRNLIVHNPDHHYLLEHCISRCYLAEVPKVLESYFSVTTQVLIEKTDYNFPFWKLLGLCLFMLGNDQSEIRSKAAQLLRILEERQHRSSKMQDFDISISDKTQAVYKLAQFEISKRLSKQYTDLAFHIFSEFTLFFKDLQANGQRNVIAVVLPWIQSIELKVDPHGGPIAESYVLLANLFEITIKSSGALHNEVQALWQALATGPHPGNVRLVLDFIISLCLERREQNFVEYAKQIVVFLSSTNSTPGIKVVEFLLMQISPKAMAPNEKREAMPPPPDINMLPYCADLSEALPVGTKQAGFSLGQLCLILLVDLMVSPVHLTHENVPVLLQVVTVLWDHYTPLVQEQAREMLVHLIHELVISQFDDETPSDIKNDIEDLVDKIRQRDRSVDWIYDDSNGKKDDTKVPPSMEYLTEAMVRTFTVTFPGIKEHWSRLSLTWATSCPVRHLACRSFQIFRCILTSLDHLMLGDMLARLSNTIADEDPEIQTFSMEILTTLRTLVAELDAEKLQNLPQLFWTICACLESINEREFLEAVEMLEEFMTKVDLRSVNVRRLLLDGKPSRWDESFEGIQPLLHKGLRSSLCWEKTLAIVDMLVQLPSDSLVGDDSRLFFAILANFPRFLHELEQPSIGQDVIRVAENLVTVCESQSLASLADVLDEYASRKYRSSRDFLVRLFGGIREFFLPNLDFKMITFCMGLLTNSLSWVKIQTMRILCVAIPEVDMKGPDIAGHGSDLITPLLRLLQTEYCMDALQVLDNIMTMSGSSMDKHHLRMSLTRPTSRAIRKEYERTQSLFGIPESSGWAIPMPARKTDSTRANIHAAFYTCQSGEGFSTDATPTPEVEFHADDFPYGYFQGHERAETMMSDEAPSTSNVGDLVTKLDSLDDFFDDDDPAGDQFTDEGRSSRTITEYSPEAFESGAQLYDEHILPILHQASNNTSLQNGFTDRPPAALSREASANAMNPGAFSIVASPRPAMHGRSTTLPMGTGPASLNEVMSDDDCAEDLFSDADDERPNTSGGEGSYFIENMVRPLQQGSRAGLRRMTGGRLRDGERMQGRLAPGAAQAGALRFPIPGQPGGYAPRGAGQGDMM